METRRLRRVQSGSDGTRTRDLRRDRPIRPRRRTATRGGRRHIPALTTAPHGYGGGPERRSRRRLAVFWTSGDVAARPARRVTLVLAAARAQPASGCNTASRGGRAGVGARTCDGGHSKAPPGWRRCARRHSSTDAQGLPPALVERLKSDDSKHVRASAEKTSALIGGLTERERRMGYLRFGPF
jgi:hypothetical protein